MDDLLPRSGCGEVQRPRGTAGREDAVRGAEGRPRTLPVVGSEKIRVPCFAFYFFFFFLPWIWMKELYSIEMVLFWD